MMYSALVFVISFSYSPVRCLISIYFFHKFICSDKKDCILKIIDYMILHYA